MENRFLNKFNKIVSIKVSGKNIYRFINRLVRKNEVIYDMNVINSKEVIVKVNYDVYMDISKNKSIYEIDLVDIHGRVRFLSYLKKYYIFILFIILGIISLIFLSNIIFKVEVIHSDSDLKDLLFKELKKNGIDKYIYKKSYSELEEIEQNILDNNKDRIEWLEIVRDGTKYIVRVEERKLNDEKEEDNYQDIVALKSGIITKVMALGGEILRNTNDYVTKDSVIISGNITLPNGEVFLTKAIGKVYAEVWYVVDVSYPYIYREEILTGKVKDVYLFNVFNKRISLFDFDKYNTFKKSDKVLFSDMFKLVTFVKEKQYEMIVTDEFYTKEEAVDKGIAIALKKIKDTLKDGENVIKYHILDSYYDEREVKLKIFFSVNEEIGIARKIEDNNIDINE